MGASSVGLKAGAMGAPCRYSAGEAVPHAARITTIRRAALMWARRMIKDGQRIRVHGTDGYVEILA
jgi:hypothetical protein